MGLLDYLFNNTKAHRWVNHRNAYILGLMTVACGLAWSHILMSIGQLILVGNWLTEGDVSNKLKLLKTNSLLHLLLLLYLLHFIGMAWTDDYNYGLKDLRVKLPLLALPIIIGSTKKLNKNEWKAILIVYLFTIFSLTLASLWKYLGLSSEEITDKRQLAIYISHIRYGLNIAFACFLAWYYRALLGKNIQYILILMALWFITCLFTFQQYTGLFILLLILFSLFSYHILYKYTSIFPRILAVIVVVVGCITVYHFINQVKEDFYKKVALNYDQHNLNPQYSQSGSLYWHDLKDKRKENGVYIRRFVAWHELEREWNKRSDFQLMQDRDIRGNQINHTLLRYLSSRGLKKDSVAIALLSDEEIRGIETGIANEYYLHHNPFQNRIHETFFSLEEYKRSKDADGYSFLMRIEFWKTSKRIIQKNFWLGVGTGDIKNAFLEQYEIDKSMLDERFRRRAHNQYLSIFATLGIVGLLLFIIFLFYPLFHPINNRIIYHIFLSIMVISFLTEDTLESQAGVTLFAFFNSLLLLGLEQINPLKKDSA